MCPHLPAPSNSLGHKLCPHLAWKSPSALQHFPKTKQQQEGCRMCFPSIKNLLSQLIRSFFFLLWLWGELFYLLFGGSSKWALPKSQFEPSCSSHTSWCLYQPQPLSPASPDSFLHGMCAWNLGGCFLVNLFELFPFCPL